MAASIRFDQVGLPAGANGQSRSDGLANGAQVSVTNASGQPCRVEFWWKPPDDSTAAVAQASPTVWQFSPQAARYGEYIVRLIEAEGTPNETEDIKAFGIRLPNSNLLIPGLNSKGSQDINLASTTAEKEAAALASFRNEGLADDAAIDWSAWWESQQELYKYVDSVAGVTEIIGADGITVTNGTGPAVTVGGAPMRALANATVIGVGATPSPGGSSTIYGNGCAPNATGFGNTCIGATAAALLSTGTVNTCLGINAAPKLSGGNSNLVLGNGAAAELTTGNANHILGSPVASLTTQSSCCLAGPVAYVPPGVSSWTNINALFAGQGAGNKTAVSPQDVLGFGVGLASQLAQFGVYSALDQAAEGAMRLNTTGHASGADLNVHVGNAADPNGIVTAPIGSLFISSSATLWQNTDGATAWAPPSTTAAQVTADDAAFTVLVGTDGQTLFDDIDDYLDALSGDEVGVDDTNLGYTASDVQGALENISIIIGRKLVQTPPTIATGNNEAVTFPLTTEGLVTFMVAVIGTNTGGTQFEVIREVFVRRASGVVTVLEEVDIFPVEDPMPAEMTVSYADSSGDLQVTVDWTGTGSLNAEVTATWDTLGYPAAP